MKMFFKLKMHLGEFLMKIGYLVEMTIIYYPEIERGVYFGRTMKQWQYEQKIGCK